jgi:Tol biopolymer transport system component
MITRRQAIRVTLMLCVVALAANLVRLRLMHPAAGPRAASVLTLVAVPPGRALDSFAISQDGNTLAYAADDPDGRLHLYLRVEGAVEREVLDAAGAHDPFFSPDGRSVAFFSRDAIWRVPVSGGPPERVADAPGDSAGGTWTEDGRIVFAPLDGRGLCAVSSGGGPLTTLTTLSAGDGELSHGWPHALPGGAILFTVSQRGRDPHLETVSGAKRGGRLVPAIGQAAFTSSGHIIYSYLGSLYEVPFDLEALKTTSVPVMFARGVQTTSGFDQLGRAAFAVSRGGTLAWVRAGAGDANNQLVRVATGTSTRSSVLGAADAPYLTPRLSPDGRQLAVVVNSGLMTRDIRVLEMGHPDRIIATFRGGDNQSPAWLADGRLSFASNREGLQKIYITAGRPAAGRDVSLAITPLFSMDVQSARNPSSWVKKPPLLAFYEIDPFRARDVMIYRVGEAIFPVAATAANERSPVLSPDGLSIAWVSDATGRDEIYLKKLEDQGEPQMLTKTGGVEPVWSAAGLWYREGDRVLRDGVPVFEGRFEKDPGANGADYDVDPKGKFLVMLRRAGGSKEIRVVTNAIF